MSYYRWWHRAMRLLTKPKREYIAAEWANKLSIAYAVLAWNAFGIICYNVIKNDKKEGIPEGDAALTTAERMAKASTRENVKLIRLNGLQMQIVDYSKKKEANSEVATGI